MCKLKKIAFYISLLPIALLFFVACSVDNSVGYRNIVSTLGGIWGFDGQENYTFDETQVEIIGGKAKLKEVDQQHSGNDFERGTHVGSYVNLNNNLSILQKPTAASTHVDTILPGRSANLAGYWRFDGNFSDSSSSGNLGVPQGNADTSSLGKVGSNSGNFNGGGDGLELSEKIDFNNKSFTIAFWLYMRTDASRGGFFQRTAGGAFNGIGFGKGQSNLINFNIIDDSGNSIVPNVPQKLNEWVHYVGSYNHLTKTAKIYENGVESVAQTNALFTNAISSNLHYLPQIMMRDGSTYVDGDIDELAIWNDLLDPTDIFNLYSAQNADFSQLSAAWTPEWDNIVGYWTMDGNWQDSSGKGNHVVAVGGATFASESKVGSHAGEFGGGGDSVHITDSSDFDIGSAGITVSAWVKPTVSATSEVVNKGMDTGYNGFRLRFSAAQTAAFGVADGTSWFYATGPGNDVKLNQWSHILGVYDGANVKIYINGELKSTTAFAGPAVNSPYMINIGEYVSDAVYAFTGKIDDVSIWGSGLTQTQVSTIYNRQKQKYAGHYSSPVIDLGASGSWTILDAKTTLPFYKEIVAQNSEGLSDYPSLRGDLSNGLVGYWKFNEISLNTAPDLGSGNTDFFDTAGNSRHAVEFGGVEPGADGLNKSSVSFDGSNDYIEALPLISDYQGLSNGTISIWFRSTGNSFESLYSLSEASTTVNFQLLYLGDSTGTYPDESLSFTVRRDGLDALRMYVRNGHTFYQNGEWHHALVRIDGVDNSIYVDGKKQAVTFLSGGTSTSEFSNITNADSIVIGAANTGGVVNSFFTGNIDDLTLWNRGLTDDEVQQLYRRGANRIKYQVKSCVDSSCNCKEFKGANPTSDDCDGDGVANISDADNENTLADFTGPGGNGVTSFSELYNRDSNDMTFSCSNNTTDADSNVCVDDEITLAGDPKATSSSFSFFDFPSTARPADNRYFQYRVMMEAEENSACGGEPCLPELTSIEVGPTGRYFSGTPSIVNKSSHPIDKILDNLQVSASSGCDLSYQISNDGSTFYYWNGSSWVAGSNVVEANDLETLNDNIKSFAKQIGLGEFHFKSYLGNSNFGECELDKVQVIKARK